MFDVGRSSFYGRTLIGITGTKGEEGKVCKKMRPLRYFFFISILFILIIQYACTSPKYSHYPKQPPKQPSKKEVQVGVASWYGADFHGKKTSSGEVYNMYGMTAAHRTLLLGTYVMVKNLENNKSVELKVNDRGPFIKGRIIDLSFAAAKKLDIVDCGIAMVRVEVTKRPEVKALEYTLQVGSFKEKRNALSLKHELDKKYKDTYVVAAMDSDTEYYRVRLGNFNSRESAEEIAKRLIKDGYAVFTTRKD